MNPAGSIAVAVLDDDPDFREYMEDFLRDEGRYTVRTFANSAEMLAALAAEPAEMVLLDMKMGQERGDEVLAALQESHPGVCVIIVTGYPSLEDMRTTFRLKVFDYIAKPFSLAQMRQVLQNAVEARGLGRSAVERLKAGLGQRLRMLRTERGWSLKDLAAAARMSVSQLSAIERGTNLPSMESFLAVARALDRKPGEILADIGF
jgi:DNA-binding NtrC family response regulator